MSQKEFRHKKILITGAAGGIGFAVAQAFDSLGAHCLLCDINEDRLLRLSKNLQNQYSIFICDVTDLLATKKMIAQIQDDVKGFDMLIHCAGVIYPGAFEQSSWTQIEKQLQINLHSTIYLSKLAIEHFKLQEQGAMVTISSLAGIVPETYSAVYSATKFAIRGFNQTLHIELKKKNIFVGTVFPDSVDTAMLEYEALHNGSPLTFLSKPCSAQTVAKAVVKAVQKKKIETYVPRFSATLPKILQTMPFLIPPLWLVLEKIGERKKQIYLKKMKQIERKMYD